MTDIIEGNIYTELAPLLEAVERVKKNNNDETTSNKIQKNDKDIIVSLWDRSGKILVNDEDSTPEFLIDKIIQGDNIVLSIEDNGGIKSIRISGVDNNHFYDLSNSDPSYDLKTIDSGLTFINSSFAPRTLFISNNILPVDSFFVRGINITLLGDTGVTFIYPDMFSESGSPFITLEAEKGYYIHRFGGSESWKIIELRTYYDINWDTYVSSGAPIEALAFKGYTTKSGFNSITRLPLAADSIDNQLIGVAADSTSSSRVELSDSLGVEFLTLKNSHSAIFRFSGNLNTWIIVASYTPIENVETSTTFYVDAFSSITGNGSISLPFQTLAEGRDAVIGIGTATSPEFPNAIIRVLAGSFTINTSLNLYINSVSWDFSSGVDITYNGGGYIFDNSIDTNLTSNSIMKILGKLRFVTQVQNSGFIYSEGTDEQLPGTFYRQIEASFERVDSDYDPSSSTLKGIPLIKTDTITGGNTNNNGFTTSLILEGDRIGGFFIEAALCVKNGGSVVGSNIAFTHDFSTNNVGNKATDRILIFESANNSRLENITLGGTQTENLVDIKGADTGFLRFENITIVGSGTTADLYRTHQVFLVLDSYTASIRGNNASAANTGLRFKNVFMENANYLYNANTPYFLSRETSGTNIAADIDGCSLFLPLSSDITYGFYEGDPTVQGTPDITPFRQGVEGYFSPSTPSLVNAKQTPRYYNISNVDTDLPSNSIWKNGTTLSIT